MRSKRWVGTFGWGLIVAGTAAMIWIVSMAAKMDAIASDLYYRQPDSSLGYGELELWVRDLRLATLTLVLAGIATVFAPRLNAGRGRRVLAITGLTLLCSPALMGEFVGYDEWVMSALPTGYVAAVVGMQIALTISGLVALLLAARRVTGWYLATVAAAVAIGALLIGGDGFDWPWFVLGLAMYVGLATSAAVAGELTQTKPLRRTVVAGAVSALGYLPACLVAVFVNLPIGAAALELNGGHIDVDGLPLYLTGPLSAWMAVVVYLTAVNRWTIFLPKAVPETAPSITEAVVG